MKGKERLIHEKTALFLCKGDPKMYIDITIDLKHYNGSVFDLRLSDYHPVKKAIDIAWQAQSVAIPPREGHWIRVVNKDTVFSGECKLSDCGITNGDRLEIL